MLSCSLEFAILIPSTISPTIQHPSGKLQYFLSASAEDSNGDQSRSRSKEVQLVSTGASAAISTSNEEALVDIVSYNHAVGVCCLSYLCLLAPRSRLADTDEHCGFNFIVSQQPFSARLVSDQPTVGSLLYLHLHLPSPREGVVLYQISVSAIQKTIISSRQYGTSEQITERHLLRLFNLPHNKGFSDIPPLFEEVQQIQPWKAGDEVTLEHMLRLPSHDVSAGLQSSKGAYPLTAVCNIQIFSPSTPRHLRRDKSAPINLTTSHSICLKLRYGTPEREVKELQISRDFTLLSCKCVADTVVAPAYSVKDPRATKRQGLIPHLNFSGNNTGPSVSQYGHTPAGQGCACVREGNAEQITSLWKERFAAPPDLQVDQKLARA